MSEQLEIRQRRRELLITVAYTIFSTLMIIVTRVEHWPVVYVPVIALEIAFIWWSYTTKFQTYVIRAFLVTGMTCLNILLYGFQGENFYVLIPTLCVEFVLLSLYEMTQVMGMTIIQTAVLLLYHIMINRDAMIPDSTLEQNRCMLQLLSLVILIALCIYRIRHHVQEEEDFAALEEKVKSEQKVKDDFMANTSHELRTPINTVSGMCEILLQKKLPDDIHSSVLDIQMTGVELQSIVNDIMDYAALEADTMELAPRAYSITSTLNDIMNMTMFENREKQLEIIFDCNPNIPRLLEGDEQQLRRILNNLISNAIKFTSEGGVTVRVDYRPEEYGINLIASVKDTGVGIGMEEQETILRGFYQSDSDRNRSTSGMGLGLTISSALVKKMGGFLTLKSELGKGSEFAFAIPQKVLDNQPCISLARPAAIKLIWYYKSQSPVASIRDSFVEHIKHFSDYFGIVSQQTSSIEECKRRVGLGQGVHLILGSDEYLEDKAYFDSMSEKMAIILIADRSDPLTPAPGIHVLYKPYNAIMLAEIFNGRESSVPVHKTRQKHFTAPDAKILVVDDNLMNLKVVEGMLRKYRIRIVAATSGEEALSMIESKDYDFVFMDHMMPGMDGVECFHHIRDKKGTYYERVPIIALTANAIAGSREMFLSEGFDDFIAKPVDSALLNDVLHRFIPAEKQIFEDPEPVENVFTEERHEENEKQEVMHERIARAGSGTVSGSEIKVAVKATDPFDAMTGIDKDTALAYCDSEEDFRELAEVYCNSGTKYERGLIKAHDEKDLNGYALIAHTIKSTSKTLGALKLSELAMAQEEDAREGNEDELMKRHDEFLSEYCSILKQLSEYTGTERTEVVVEEVIREDADEENRESDLDKMKRELRECLEAFEPRAFEEYMEKIKDLSIDGRPAVELLEEVSKKVSDYDFEGAIDELKEIGGMA